MKLSEEVMLAIYYRKMQKLALMRRHKQLRSENFFFNLPDQEFFNLFRFPKYLARNVIEEISEHMSTRIRRHGLSKSLRILIALRFFATGSYQRIVGQDFCLAVSQSTVSRCIKEVSTIINEHFIDKYIVFPNISQRNEIKLRFFEKFGMPGVIGCVDGTHVSIQRSSADIEHVYVCRKEGHSKNFQIICDSDLRILFLNARFGGTAHDAFVWRSSLIKTHLHRLYEEGCRNFWLLGDSGYPQQPWLMTPILEPTSDKEERYNIAHKAARNCVERCIGLLKSRFRCLLKQRVLCYNPSDAGSIINACAVLHNILIINKISSDDQTIENIQDNVGEEVQNTLDASQFLREGRTARESLVNEHF